METGAGDPASSRDRLLQGLAVEQRELQVGGVQTSVLESGQGPPLVLLHGGIECGGVYWAPIIADLAREYRVVMPDVPGLGESEPLPRLDQAAFDDWFASLLEATGAQRPSLVAHSLLGTMVARFAATQNGLLDRIVFTGVPGVGPYRMPWRLRITAIRFAIRPTRRNAERLERLAFTDYDGVRRRNPEWMEAFAAYLLSRARVSHVKRTMRQLIGSCTKRVPDAELQRISAPVSLVWARDDDFVPLALGEAASARLGWPLAVVERAGHATHIEQPEAFVEAVKAALTSSGRPAAEAIQDGTPAPER